VRLRDASAVKIDGGCRASHKLKQGKGNTTMNGTNDPDAEKEYLCRLIQYRYGDRLSAQAFEEVKKGIDGVIKTVTALRAVPLANSDEPMPRFIPYRGED